MQHDPNMDGHCPDDDLVRAFEQRQPTLARFAEAHALFVRKHIHDYPMWAFYFFHPKGGRGSVTLSLFHKSGSLAGAVAAEWHVDDQDTLRRTTYSVPLEDLPSVDPTLIAEGLEAVLARVLSAQESDRIKSSSIMPVPRDDSGELIVSDLEKRLQTAH